MLCSITDRDVVCSNCQNEDCFQNGFVDTGCKKQLEKLIGSCRCGWQGPLIDWEVSVSFTV